MRLKNYNHLGNTRATYTAGSNGSYTATQGAAYYPFGLAIDTLSYSLPTDVSTTPNPYLYNGKELQTQLGLQWLDYGARMYDAQVGRWWSLDPLIEKHYDYTAYAYVYNNPIKLIDPFGLDTISSYADHTVNEQNVDRVTETTTIRNNNSKSTTTTIFTKTYKITMDENIEISGELNIQQTSTDGDTGETTIVESNSKIELGSEQSADLKTSVIGIADKKGQNGGLSPILKDREQLLESYEDGSWLLGVGTGVVTNFITGSIKGMSLVRSSLVGAALGEVTSEVVETLNEGAKDSAKGNYSLKRGLYFK